MKTIVSATALLAASLFAIPASAANLVLYTSQPNEDAQATVDGFMAANPELKWADTSQRGYMMIEMTPKRVTGEWLFLRTIKARDTGLAGSHRMHVERGRRVFGA